MSASVYSECELIGIAPIISDNITTSSYSLKSELRKGTVLYIKSMIPKQTEKENISKARETDYSSF